MNEVELLPLASEEAVVEDVAEVGVELALPEGLEAALAVLAAAAAPVEAAAAAGWAGLDALRVATAEANGVAVAPEGRAGPAQATAADVGWGAMGPGGDEVASVLRPEPGGEGAWMPSVARVLRGSAARGGRVVGPDARALPGGSPGLASEGLVEPVRSGEARVGVTPGRETRTEQLRDLGEAMAPLSVRSAAPEPARRRDEVAGAEASSVIVVSGGDVGADRGGERGSVAPLGGAVRSNVSRVLAERAAGRAERGPGGGVQTEPALARDSGAPAGLRQQDGREGRAGVGEGAAGSVAPTAGARDEGGGIGAVMLDGHLVGHWLSERMAREAARPGAGTTFFDPRQAPAWTPSGAL